MRPNPILEEDIMYGDPIALPKYFQPEIENIKLAVQVTIICRDEYNDQTGETYEATIEHGCRNCQFGELQTNSGICAACYKKYTPDRPYSMWKFDTNYHPCDDVYIN